MSPKQAVTSFFKQLAQGRVDDDLLAPDMTFWTPTSGSGEKARFLGGIGLLAALYAGDLAYHVDCLTEEGSRIAAEARSTGTFRDGTPYAQSHVFLFDFAGDRIRRVAEYMNTTITQEQIGPRMQAAISAATS